MGDWVSELRRERDEKDRFLAEHPHSPIPANERETFQGLEYYAPDESYRVHVLLTNFEEHEVIRIETTHDGVQTYHRWGRFQFSVNGESASLVAYKGDPSEDHFWVPFRDDTSGETTYPAGRYIDLEQIDRSDSGAWEIDFNRAYNPFCAYSDDYECPLVPMENWLDIAIEAGERYSDG